MDKPTPLTFLQTLRYPGRFLIVGKYADCSVIIYAAMGRSSASLLRRYDHQGDTVIATQLSNGGNPELLEYTSARFTTSQLIVGNGRQVDSVVSRDLATDLAGISYEPDKHKTPRLTAMIADDMDTGLLHIIRSDNQTDGCERKLFTVPLIDQQAYYMATYDSIDARPMGSFRSDPILVELPYSSARTTAESIFALLSPPTREPDYRVSVMAYYKQFGQEPNIAIVNRQR